MQWVPRFPRYLQVGRDPEKFGNCWSKGLRLLVLVGQIHSRETCRLSHRSLRPGTARWTQVYVGIDVGLYMYVHIHVCVLKSS